MDFLGLESALKPRLQARLPTGVAVLAQVELAAAEAARQATPAVHLIYAGAELIDQTPAAVKLEQTWLTVVAVRAPNDPTGERARREAGALMTTLLRALLGWAPPPAADGMRWAALVPADPLAPSVVGGVLYLPAAWTTTVVVRGID